jgi:UrcA family protein
MSRQMKINKLIVNFRRATMSAINLKSESMRVTHIRASLLVACVLAIGSSMANAAPALDVPSVTVKYSDLNLATDDGAHQLYKRISAAARVVCPDVDLRDLGAFASSKTCQSEAIARAVRDVRSPRLAAVYDARTHHG